MEKPFEILTTWRVKKSENRLEICLSSINNGQSDFIHYTSVRRYNPTKSQYEYINGSAISHGYGQLGLKEAEQRIKKLLDEQWKLYEKFIIPPLSLKERLSNSE